MSKRYGATEEEWITFDFFLGLTPDLLPVVSNPNARISNASKIKALGKTPSRYNQQRFASGIHKWTGYQASTEDIAQWSKEPDYGICVQTRHVRALDIDTEHSAPVLNHLWESGFRFPIRQRANSGKCLLAFRVGGEIPKRVCKIEGGIIEFLGNGQQFIAAGTHPTDVRYEWDGLTGFPELTELEFESLWSELVDEFAIAPPVSGHIRKRGGNTHQDDPTLDQLTVVGWGPQGQAHIECPFALEHTTESGESATSYFPAGTGGYEQGHFVCLHAHCAERADEMFLDALGLRAAEFEPLTQEAEVKTTLPATWPAFKRRKTGEIHPNLDNLYQALRRGDVCETRIAYDKFRDEIVVASSKTNVLAWRNLTDNDYTVLQRHLERFVGFEPIAIDLLRRAVRLVAYENAFDSAQLWLEGLAWDGVDRVNSFMAVYMRSEASAYTRAVSRYLWTALAGRVLVPGIKADMVPIWESGQGRIKSSAVEALVPNPEFFLEVDLDEKEDDLTRKMRGKLVGEINELRGLQTKNEQSINAFITRKYEEWVPKYVEKSQRLPRRIIFIGTTNKKEILGDETGKRRWLPTRVEYADIDSILRDRDQLWAEAREIFRKEGVCYREAEMLAPGAHGHYTIQHPWEEVILEWLETPEDIDGMLPGAKGYITMEEVMRQAVGIETRNMKGNDSREIAKVLRKHGYERDIKRVGKKMKGVWVVAGSDLL